MIEKEFKYGVIEVTDIEYHRGIIPVFQGRVCLSWQKIQRKLKMARVENELLEWWYNYNLWDRDFTSSYIEFLSPKSLDLGYNLTIDYLEIPTVEELKENIEYLHDETFLGKEELLANRLVYLIKQINEYYYQAEKKIYKLEEELEEESKEELEEELEEA